MAVRDFLEQAKAMPHMTEDARTRLYAELLKQEDVMPLASIPDEWTEIADVVFRTCVDRFCMSEAHGFYEVISVLAPLIRAHDG